MSITLATMNEQQFQFAMNHSMTSDSSKSFRRGDIYSSTVELKNAYHHIVELFGVGEDECKLVATLIGNDSLFGFAYMSAAGWHRENGEWTSTVTDRIYAPTATMIFRYYDIYVKQAEKIGIVEVD